MSDICRICKMNPQLRFSGNGAYNPYRGLCKECYELKRKL